MYQLGPRDVVVERGFQGHIQTSYQILKDTVIIPSIQLLCQIYRTVGSQFLCSKQSLDSSNRARARSTDSWLAGKYDGTDAFPLLTTASLTVWPDLQNALTCAVSTGGENGKVKWFDICQPRNQPSPIAPEIHQPQEVPTKMEHVNLSGLKPRLRMSWRYVAKQDTLFGLWWQSAKIDDYDVKLLISIHLHSIHFQCHPS